MMRMQNIRRKRKALKNIFYERTITMVRCINCGNYFYKWELITWGGSPRCPLCCDTGDFEEYKE